MLNAGVTVGSYPDSLEAGHHASSSGAVPIEDDISMVVNRPPALVESDVESDDLLAAQPRGSRLVCLGPVGESDDSGGVPAAHTAHSQPARMYCPVAGCPCADHARVPGWASLDNMKGHLNCHLSGLFGGSARSMAGSAQQISVPCMRIDRRGWSRRPPHMQTHRESPAARRRTRH